MKFLKKACIMVLVGGLLMGVVSPVLASPQQSVAQATSGQTSLYTGEVIEINTEDGYFILQSGEDELSIFVGQDTKYVQVSPKRRVIMLALQFQEKLEERIREREQLMSCEGEPGAGQQVSEQLEQALPGSQQKTKQQVRQGLKIFTEGVTALSPAAEMVKQVQEQVELRKQHRVTMGDLALKWLQQTGEEVGFDSISVGSRVSVRIITGQDSLVAEMVIIYQSVTS